ncbi:MAG: Ferredoxin, 2Fe-2S [uncultured Nocardioidaceae bacterium]|uniref:Ferredoxin, 2Fe-2S n=1 Tax=uncultured Nocardioidaceae bacterium TaxID=253824 RepID=A0A6J4LI43_9ACTN|nr:MAG: Ferredoxin, 2Fe-2S [uncultured Nocardioidaceae bacterium]
MATTPLYDAVGAPGTAPPPLVDWTRRLEQASFLDGPAGLLQHLAEALVADRSRRDLLQGRWLGHALHPVLTDLPIGFWVSTNVLDLVGGRQARPAATRLLALGVLSAVPAVITGYAEYADTSRQDKRIGFVHAASNASAIALFTASLKARRSDHHARGVLLSFAGITAASLGGFLGSHLNSARKVSSRHEAFADR